MTGETFNLLSEEVATQVAIKLNADKLIGFCSEQGVLDEAGNAIAELFPSEVNELIEKFEANELADEGQSSGTLRFLRGAQSACRAGIPRCHLISYKIDGALSKNSSLSMVSVLKSSWRVLSKSGKPILMISAASLNSLGRSRKKGYWSAALENNSSKRYTNSPS
ncbi:N-acetylglutamate synthase [Vibrio variabilis]|uniref:N-acetylglutamate synthase n=1 Tax=Vibrio variabilis TaxID=990271 RepID=A0ABQ0JLL0_9VIBR|nr:N-acetylglutamate synthase [Vibrio variabilis]